MYFCYRLRPCVESFIASNKLAFKFVTDRRFIRGNRFLVTPAKIKLSQHRAAFSIHFRAYGPICIRILSVIVGKRVVFPHQHRT